MLESEQIEILVLGSGEGGKYLAWDMASSGPSLRSREVQMDR